MAEQLTFDLPVRVSRGRGDFFVSDANALAVARLDDTAGWPHGKLALIGPEGAGKTHLAHLWAETEDALIRNAADLVDIDIAGLSQPVAVEITGALTAPEEEALFHAHNHMQSQKLPLLLIARKPPAQWDIALPDLKSRMEATDIVRISEPDDALLAAVLVKLFADRQLQVAPNVISWMIPRIDRSFADAQDAVRQLDAAALSEKRPLTRDLARKTLGEKS